MQTASSAAIMGGQPAPSAACRPNPIRRVGAWLDSHGRKAWITAMVLGFLTVWPVGLGLLAFMLMTGRFSRHAYAQGETQMFCRKSNARSAYTTHFRSSGNSAFDSYKTDMLKRLEDEQQAFESFLQRLREAKDKQEFDRFMDERAAKAAEAAAMPATMDEPARGAY